MDMDIFAKRLKETRISRNVSPAELSEAVNINMSTIYRWENGAFKSIKESKLEAIADYLKVSKDYLTGKSDDKYDLKTLKEFNKEQKIEINNVIYVTKELLKTDKVMLEGQPITKDNIEYIIDSMDVILEILKRKNKQEGFENEKRDKR